MEQRINNHSKREIVASIYEEYSEALKRYFCSYTHDIAVAEDMLQDLFLKVMNLEVLNVDASRSLLFTMARHMIVDDVRHKTFVRERQKQFIYSISNLEQDSVVKKIEAADILSFERIRLAMMPVKRANIYKMYKHDDISTDEIARTLNLSKRTVETQIYLSTKDIKSYLKRII